MSRVFKQYIVVAVYLMVLLIANIGAFFINPDFSGLGYAILNIVMFVLFFSLLFVV